MISRQFVPILLVAFWGLSTAGYFGRAQRLLFLPMLFITQALAQALFPRLAAKKSSGESLADSVSVITTQLVRIGVLPAVVVSVIGPDLFLVVCGPKWGEAGVYAQILAPWVLAMIVNSPITSLINILERIGMGFVFSVALIITRVSVIVAGGLWIGDVRISLAIFSLVSVINVVWMCFFLMGAVGASRRTLLGGLARCLLMSLPTVAVAALAKWYWHMAPWQVVSLTVGASISYWPLVFWKDPLVHTIVGEIHRRIKGLFGFGR
jgi:O-antigen/teichoic acid export membrane protein